MGMPTFWIPIGNINDLAEALLDLGGKVVAAAIPNQPDRFAISCDLPNNQAAEMSVTLDRDSIHSTINVIGATSLLTFEIAFSAWIIAIGGCSNKHMKVNTILKGESAAVLRFLSRSIFAGPNDLWTMPIRALYYEVNLEKKLCSHVKSGSGPFVIVAGMHGLNLGQSFISIYLPRMWGGVPRVYLDKIKFLIDEAKREEVICIQEMHSMLESH